MISMNFTDDAVYIVKGEKGLVSSFAKAELDGLSIQNGMLINPDAVYDAVSAVLAIHGLKREPVVITVISDRISNNQQLFPYIKKEKQLETMLKARLSGVLSSGGFVADYALRERFREDGMEKCRLDVSVAPVDLVSQYQQLMARLGFRHKRFNVLRSVMTRLCELTDKYNDAILAYVNRNMLQLHLLSQNCDVLIRKQLFKDGHVQEHIEQELIKMMQFKQITYPGSKVSTIELFGSGARSLSKDAIAEAAGVPVRMLTLPDNLKAPSGMDVSEYLFAWLGIL